jgi:hypothetical protein
MWYVSLAIFFLSITTVRLTLFCLGTEDLDNLIRLIQHFEEYQIGYVSLQQE